MLVFSLIFIYVNLKGPNKSLLKLKTELDLTIFNFLGSGINIWGQSYKMGLTPGLVFEWQNGSRIIALCIQVLGGVGCVVNIWIRLD